MQEQSQHFCAAIALYRPADRNGLKKGMHMSWCIGGGIFFFALEMFLFWKQDLVWKLTEEWKSYCADEPSEFYLKVTKICGILLALFGIVVMILPFIVE